MPAAQSDPRRDFPAFILSGFDTVDTLLPPMIDQPGTTTHRDIEIASPIGFRPLRMDLRVPRTDGPVPVVRRGVHVRIAENPEAAFASPISHAGQLFEGVDVAPIAEQSATYLAERVS